MAGRTSKSPELTEAEWRVMNALWAAGPSTTRALHERLPGETPWAYTTLKTLLERLQAKGAVTARRDAGADVYTAAVPREHARGTAVRRLLSRAFGGAAGELAHFLIGTERLSERERTELRRMLDESPRKEPRK
jgi:BlaI family transcriptional regulator, penicillinase repressor